jgi:prephenate dehydrogenase
MWTDLFLSNREALLESLGGFRAALAALEADVIGGDAAALRARLTVLRALKSSGGIRP